MSTSELSGSWTYRSFNPEYVTGNETPHQLIVADDVVLTLRTAPDPTGLAGEIEWQGGGLDLNGTVVISGDESFDLVGIGRRETDGWEYRYNGHLTAWWPGGNQHPTLVGSVIRVKPHNGQPGGWQSAAGEVFSFIAMKQPLSEWGLTGSWAYRSFHNETAPQTAHPLILQEAVFKLKTPTSTTLQGTIELPRGVLDIGPLGLQSEMVGGEPPRFTFEGIGRPGTATDGWEYRYQGHLTRNWPNAVNQRPALVGNVIRVKPHGEAAPAGYVAPFIAVKQ